MQFLETRSEVKFKVKVTQLWYVTLRHPLDASARQIWDSYLK